MRAFLCVPFLCLGIFLSPAAAQKNEKEDQIRQAEEKARQTERQLEIGRSVGRLLLDMAQRDARAKQRPDDEEKLKLAQSALELVIGVSKQVNQLNLDSQVKDATAQQEAAAKAEMLRQRQEDERRLRELDEYRQEFRGVVDIYLQPQELQEGKPALPQVIFEGIAVFGGRKMLHFRKADRDETWTLDPSRILAVRSNPRAAAKP